MGQPRFDETYCRSLGGEYGVSVGHTWGSLPEELKSVWQEKGCDCAFRDCLFFPENLPAPKISGPLHAALIFRFYSGPWEVDVDDCTIVHWIEYMLYSGVTHFYLYDNSKSAEEEARAERVLGKYFKSVATRVMWPGGCAPCAPSDRSLDAHHKAASDDAVKKAVKQ